MEKRVTKTITFGDLTLTQKQVIKMAKVLWGDYGKGQEESYKETMIRDLVSLVPDMLKAAGLKVVKC